jgi:Zn-dependent M28 family amino/carboxypeptidase
MPTENGQRRTENVLRRSILPLVGIVVLACARPTPHDAGFPPIDAAAILAHTKVLSSDEYEGRAPGTRGEDLTVGYLVEQFTRAGLQPGNPDGTWLQAVPLVGITPDPSATLTWRRAGHQRVLRFKDDFVAWTKRMVETSSLDRSELVFVGYGVQAPEFQWDDIKGARLAGKTLVFLVGDPPVADAARPGALDPAVFGGQAMTYYGRWSYKFEQAQRLGAAGALIVHETAPAGYAFSVVQTKTGEQLAIASPDRNMGRAAVEGWLTLDQSKALFEMAGLDFDQLKAAAASRQFAPIPLGVTASLTLHNRLRTVESHNVVGRVPGSDDRLKAEHVIYSAHWDGLGVGPEVGGERICHGAKDNAVAVGGLIEIARAFAALPQKPRRSVLFLAVTAEEQLLLGSEYYATNPLYPIGQAVANINLEMLNVHGPTRDLTVIGLGQSELDGYARDVAALQGRTLRADPEPERGMYYRSDHFSFARRGVPAFEPDEGADFVGKPTGYGLQVRQAFYATDYHKPADTVKPDWNLSGGVADLQVDWLVGYRVAQAGSRPRWNPGAEFGPK